MFVPFFLNHTNIEIVSEKLMHLTGENDALGKISFASYSGDPKIG
jgi:hypothetical protein